MLALHCPPPDPHAEDPIVEVRPLVDASEAAPTGLGSVPRDTLMLAALDSTTHRDDARAPGNPLLSDEEPGRSLTTWLRTEQRAQGLRYLGEALSLYELWSYTGEGMDRDEAARRVDALERAALTLVAPVELTAAMHEQARRGEQKQMSRTGDMPRPRKHDLVGHSLVTRLAERSAENVPHPLPGLSEACARVLLDMGGLYADRGNHPAAFELFSAGMRLRFDAWLDRSARLHDPFLESAIFMVLSGQRADKVVALYDDVPLDRTPLEEGIVEQIDQRLNIYRAARRRHVRGPDLSQVMGDLLHALVEDPHVRRLVPESDWKRFVQTIADVALKRQFHQEAIGALAALGDTERLVRLGRRWSKNVVGRHKGTYYVNRDIELAMTAFLEAEDYAALRELLHRCREAQALAARQAKPLEGVNYLTGYINRLARMLESGDRYAPMRAAL